MARFRKPDPEPLEPPAPPRRSITAAAAILSDRGDGMAAYRARGGEDAWQKTAWAYYDSIGELNAAVKWVSNAVSLADMYAAETDPETGLESEPTDNAVVQAVVSQILGGAVKRSQYQATITTNWLVAGEVFIVVRSEPRGDQWFVLSSTEVTERGGVFKYNHPTTGMMTEVRPRDLIMRIWNPHARIQSHADSSVRSAAPILAEVERTTMNIAARLDSRLAGAGVLWVPEEADFPITDADAEEDEDSLLSILQRAMAASLRDPGTSASQVPIVVPLRSDLIPTVVHQSFTTEVAAEVIELRDNAVRRLALSLDMPPEIMTGTGETNHWSAWQIEESTYKIHVAPLLDRIADALTFGYLHPVLERMGVADPDRYMLAFNTKAIVSRPNQFDELTQLHNDAVISDDYYRAELGIPDDAVPTEEDRLRQLAITLVTQAPSLVQTIPELLEIIGFGDITVTPGDNPQASLDPGAEPGTNDGQEQRALPAESEQSGDTDQGLVAAAELMVYDALSRAGGRLLTRGERGRHGDTEKFALHTVIDGSSRAEELLEGSFQLVGPTAAAFGRDADRMHRQLRDYCLFKIATRKPHDREELSRWLTR